MTLKIGVVISAIKNLTFYIGSFHAYLRVSQDYCKITLFQGEISKEHAPRFTEGGVKKIGQISKGEGGRYTALPLDTPLPR